MLPPHGTEQLAGGFTVRVALCHPSEPPYPDA
jgi:hypothetical protein